MSEVHVKELEPRVEVIPAFPSRYLRFGEFQLDLHREEIWKGGARVRMQGKAYHALLTLLSRAGDVVTRDEVRRQLWPDASLVNSEASVNTAMNKLRQALGDKPENPAYIQTIPRRGYCFIAPVETAESLLLPSAESKALGIAGSAAPKEAQLSTWTFPIGLRIVTLFLAGMLAGSILTLAWTSFSRNHNLFRSSALVAFGQAECV